MASEPIECQVLVLRVSIHCEGCKKKVKKVLQNVHGVLRCDIDARSNKVVVTASTKLDPNILVAKLRRSGKQAEPWPVPPAAESQSQDTGKKENDEPSKPAENPGPNSAEASAAEPSSNPQPSPEPNNAGDAPKPARERGEASNTDASSASDEATAAVAPQQQPNEAKGKAKQQQPEERQPVDARVTVEYDRGGDGYTDRVRMPAQQPVIMSYNMARPSPSASYYAAPPAPMVAGPPQGYYIDEHYAPPYYGRSSPYEPYYYDLPQPSSPYLQPAASTEDYHYYYSAPPQRSAFSPPRDGYGDMFDDENANSCAVM